MIRVFVYLAVFAYLMVAVKLFRQLDQIIDQMIHERFGDDKAHEVIANICVILCCLFWPALLFMKGSKNS